MLLKLKNSRHTTKVGVQFDSILVALSSVV